MAAGPPGPAEGQLSGVGVIAGHYSLLQTIEQNFGLPLLGNAGDTVQVSSLDPLLH
jgi:hypothetical protein